MLGNYNFCSKTDRVVILVLLQLLICAQFTGTMFGCIYAAVFFTKAVVELDLNISITSELCLMQKLNLPYFHEYNENFFPAIWASKNAPCITFGLKQSRSFFFAFFSLNTFVPGMRLVLYVWNVKRKPAALSSNFCRQLLPIMPLATPVVVKWPGRPARSMASINSSLCLVFFVIAFVF